MKIKKVLNHAMNYLGISDWYAKKNYKSCYPDYRSEIKNIEKLKNKYYGKRVYVLGNGPSLKDVDFSLLRDEYTFTVNQLSRHPDFKKLRTNFHIWADDIFFDIDKQSPEDMELLSVMLNVKSDENAPIVFYEYRGKKMVDEFDLAEKLNIYLYAQTHLNTNRYYRKNKILDFCEIVPDFNTVVQSAMWLAVYMGFKEIILLGCDCTSFVNIANAKLNSSQNADYVYRISPNEKKRMEKQFSTVDVCDALSNCIRMLNSYKTIYAELTKLNVKVLNASSTTLIDSIPRVDLEEIL